MKTNSLHSRKNQELKLGYNDLNIISFKIIRDSKSAKLYANHDGHVIKGAFVPINVIFETKTEYIYSNCDELSVLLGIYQGISDYEIKNDPIAVFLFLSLIDEYLELWNVLQSNKK